MLLRLTGEVRLTEVRFTGEERLTGEVRFTGEVRLTGEVNSAEAYRRGKLSFMVSSFKVAGSVSL